MEKQAIPRYNLFQEKLVNLVKIKGQNYGGVP